MRPQAGAQYRAGGVRGADVSVQPCRRHRAGSRRRAFFRALLPDCLVAAGFARFVIIDPPSLRGTALNPFSNGLVP
ncbi:hypothetical protein ACKJM2_08555, partial [Neisseria gonorrhoeae]